MGAMRMVRPHEKTWDAVAVWAGVGIGLVFLGGWGYVAVHFIVKFW